MATVSGPDGQEISEEEQVAALVAAGMSEEQARFVIALESGKIDGDIVEVDAEGNDVGTSPGA